LAAVSGCQQGFVCQKAVAGGRRLQSATCEAHTTNNDERWTFTDVEGERKLKVVVVPPERAWLTIVDQVGNELAGVELDPASARALGRVLLDEFRGPTEPMEPPI